MELPVQLIQRGIERGSILLSDSFEDIDHAKFFAIVGVYEDRIAGFFFINSRIHPIVQAKPEQFIMQFNCVSVTMIFCVTIHSSVQIICLRVRLLIW